MILAQSVVDLTPSAKDLRDLVDLSAPAPRALLAFPLPLKVVSGFLKPVLPPPVDKVTNATMDTACQTASLMATVLVESNAPRLECA